MLGEISILTDEEIQNSKKDMEGIGNCFMELVNLIIYEESYFMDGNNSRSIALTNMTLTNTF
jgi:hypothetical protein